MPLTLQEQQELSTLNARAKPQASGLSSEEQQELAQLNARSGDAQGGMSVVQSEPITELDKAQAAFDRYARDTPSPKKKSIIPQAIGAAAGSLIAVSKAQKAPVPVRIAAGLTGTALGAMGGKGLQQLSTGDLDDIRKAYGEQLGAAKTEVISDVISMPLGGLIGRALSGGFARKSLQPGMERLTAKLSEAGKRASGANMSVGTRQLLRKGGAGLTEGQKGSHALRSVEQFIEGSYVGGGRLKQIVGEANPAALNVLKKDLTNQYWVDAGGRMSKDEVAQEINDVLNRNMGKFKSDFAAELIGSKGPMDPLVIGETVKTARETVANVNRGRVSDAYKVVEDLASESGIASMEKGNFVSLDNATKAAKQIQDTWQDRGPSALRTQMMDLSDVILSGPSKTDFANADKGIRSQLLSEARKLDTVGQRTKNPTMSKAIESITSGVKTDLDVALSRFDPAISDALDEARGKAAKNIQFEENPFVKHISKLANSETPEALIPAIFSSGSPKKIEMATRALGKNTMDELADTWLNKTVTEAMGDKSSIGGSLQKKLDKMGRGSLDKIYGTAKTDDLYAIAKLYRKTGSEFIEKSAIKGAVNLAESNPSLVAKKVFQKDNVTSLKKWKSQLGPGTYKKVLATWVDDASQAGLDKSLDNVGNGMLKEMFTNPQHLKDIKDIARIEKILATSGGGSRVLAPILEAGAVAGVITNPSRAVATGAVNILAGLPIAGALLSHPQSARWLSKGMRNPRKFQLFLSKATAELTRSVRAVSKQKEIVDKKRRQREAFAERTGLPTVETPRFRGTTGRNF